MKKEYSAKDYSDGGKFYNSLPFWLRTFIHECIAHPIAGLCWIFRFDKAGYAVHNKTAPMLCVKCERRFDAEVCPLCKGELV